MIRNPGSVPDPMLCRWLGYIHLFNFEIEKNPRSENSLADALGRIKYQDDSDEENDGGEGNLLEKYAALNIRKKTAEEMIHDELKKIKLGDRIRALYGWHSNNPQAATKLKNVKQFFSIEKNLLVNRGADGQSRRVIIRPSERKKIIQEAHCEIGHRGAEGTYARIQRLFYWPKMYKDVKELVQKCDLCQRFGKRQGSGILLSRPVRDVMEEVALDHVFVMDEGNGKKYLIVGRCTFTGWVEAQVVKSTDAGSVIKFLETEIYARHGPIPRFLADNGTVGGPEVRKYVESRGAY
jgi:hypothetical protein